MTARNILCTEKWFLVVWMFLPDILKNSEAYMTKNRTVSASCNFVVQLRWPQSCIQFFVITTYNISSKQGYKGIPLYYNSSYVSFEIGWQEVWWLLTLVFHRFSSSVGNPCYSISDKTLNMKRFNFYAIQFFLISP